jgi:hypothetical protein
VTSDVAATDVPANAERPGTGASGTGSVPANSSVRRRSLEMIDDEKLARSPGRLQLQTKLK